MMPYTYILYMYKTYFWKMVAGENSFISVYINNCNTLYVFCDETSMAAQKDSSILPSSSPVLSLHTAPLWSLPLSFSTPTPVHHSTLPLSRHSASSLHAEALPPTSVLSFPPEFRNWRVAYRLQVDQIRSSNCVKLFGGRRRRSLAVQLTCFPLKWWSWNLIEK